MNDLPKASHFETRLYADDTALILSEKELDTLNKNVSKELIKVENWLNKNKLSINLAKTKYMLIKPNIKNFTKTNNIVIYVSGVILGRSYSTKHLGLILDEDLTWKLHLHYMPKKLAQGVSLMAKMRKYLSNKNLLSLYYAFFYSHALYGILGWDSATKFAIVPIQILQNKAIRIINNSTWKNHINSNRLFLKYSILQIEDIYKFELSKFMHLFHTNALPEIFDTYFLFTEHAHHYNTRSKSN